MGALDFLGGLPFQDYPWQTLLSFQYLTRVGSLGPSRSGLILPYHLPAVLCNCVLCKSLIVALLECWLYPHPMILCLPGGVAGGDEFFPILPDLAASTVFISQLLDLLTPGRDGQ